jgi:cyclase
MKTSLVCVTALFTLAFVRMAIAQDDVVDAGSLRLIAIAEGIYAVEPKFAGANGAVILSDSGNIVVDTHGSPASAKALIKAIANVSDEPVRYVINTHWHVDHHSGNEAYKRAFGNDVIFISHDLTREEIPTLGAAQFVDTAPYRLMPVESANAELSAGHDTSDRQYNDAQIADIGEFRDGQIEFTSSEDFEFTLADLTYEKSITLHGGPNSVEVFYLYPGHTKSDSIVYVRDQKILIVGDLLTKPILWSWSSYPSSYIQTLLELEQLPVEKTVIGHGGPVLYDDSYLIQVRQFLEVVVEYSHLSFEAGTGEGEAIVKAATHEGIQKFRRDFVGETDDGMFDQMVSWTISRALEELSIPN